MTKKWDMRLAWGGLLVLGGILFLLQNLGYFNIDNLAWGIVFGIVGLLFLSVPIGNRANWWGVIPGMVFLGLAALMILSPLYHRGAQLFGGSLFLGMIGLSFGIIFLLQPTFWWALIPGGTLITLAIVALASQIVTGFETGSLLFLGLGLTFCLLTFVHDAEAGDEYRAE